jgi:hypothetical protein
LSRLTAISRSVEVRKTVLALATAHDDRVGTAVDEFRVVDRFEAAVDRIKVVTTLGTAADEFRVVERLGVAMGALRVVDRFETAVDGIKVGEMLGTAVDKFRVVGAPLIEETESCEGSVGDKVTFAGSSSGASMAVGRTMIVEELRASLSGVEVTTVVAFVATETSGTGAVMFANDDDTVVLYIVVELIILVAETVAGGNVAMGTSSDIVWLANVEISDRFVPPVGS